MLTSIHFLLTYTCTYECDHCFLYCSPRAKGTFTISQLNQILEEIKKIRSIDNVYFEGGEPFLFYPLMLEGIRMARGAGLQAGVVTNGYWATSKEDAALWLKPLAELGIFDLSISDDSFHNDENENSTSKTAFKAAQALGIPANTICIEKPAVVERAFDDRQKGAPVIGGGVMFKGRAAEKLISDLPKKNWRELNRCPHEDLENPSRVHIDSYGNVHLCQGLCMGNIWETPLSELVKEYDTAKHPICAPLVKGGPPLLAQKYNLQHEDEYIDECHFCFLMRRALMERFRKYLAPNQVYGLE
jgi:MoaA/NifB/PqqE/SkfB family radical SAM enzyme